MHTKRENNDNLFYYMYDKENMPFFKWEKYYV